MKHFTLFLLLAIGLIHVPAQAQRRGYAYGPTSQFEVVLKQISYQNNDPSKMVLARNFFSANHFNVVQLNQILFQLRSENNRVRLAKDAYFLVSDVRNFKNVSAAIQHPANRQELRFFVRDQQGRAGGGQVNPRQVNFPVLNYPNAQSYRGAFGCNSYADAATFNRLSLAIFDATTDLRRQQLINDYMRSHHFTVGQYMRLLTIVNSMDIRYTLAQNHLGLLYDLDNRHHIALVFGQTAYNQRFLNHLKQYRPNRGRGRFVERPYVTEFEMQAIIRGMKNEISNRNRMRLAEAAVQSNPGFTTAQIRRMMNTFTFDSYRLSFAKFAYHKTIDRSNYYLLTSELTFSRNKRSLLNFIQNNP